MNKETKEVLNYSYSINRGILLMNPLDDDAERADIKYDFNCNEYKELKEKYDIEKIAGRGGEFTKAKRLLNYFSKRLTHYSVYDNHIEQNSLALLEYSFNNPEHGINCLNKSKIFSEICLSIGIKARRVFIAPYSPLDCDSHVVCEIYDSKMKKWIFMDPTSNGFFVDENNMPLSILEMRDRFANNEFLTICHPGFKGDLNKLEEKSVEDNWYISKNFFRFAIEDYQGFGNKKVDKVFTFFPKGFDMCEWDIKNCEYRIKMMKEFAPDLVPQFEKELADLKNGKIEFKNYSLKSIS